MSDIRRARQTQKTAMLEEFAKSAVAIANTLKRPLSQPKTARRRTKRSATYSKAAITTLAKVWQASGYLCSQLKAALPQWLP